MKRRTFSFILGFCMVLFASVAAFSAEAVDNQIAVMDFDVQGLQKSTGIIAAELVRTELANARSFTVIERDRINLILKEHGFQQSGCTDQSCAVEMGKLLSANKILIGTVMRLGGQIIITVRLVDVQSGRIDCGEKESSTSVEGLNLASERLAQKISLCGSGTNYRKGKPVAGKIQRQEVIEVDTQSPYYRNPAVAAAISIVPCWSGSFYPYDFDIDRFPGMGIFMSISKTVTFATGLGSSFAALYYLDEANTHKFFDETAEQKEDEKQFDKTIKVTIIAFAVWGGLTLMDIIYSAVHVNSYNMKYARPEKKLSYDFSFAITPRLRPVGRDMGLPVMDGVDAAVCMRW